MVHLNGVSNAHAHATDMCGVVSVRAPDIVELQLCFNRDIDGLNRGHVERGADRWSLRAGAVVAADIDDQRIIQLAQVFHLSG